ncbi:MAG TPA: EAL domain-containing protein [Rhodocyclaceae bacterium]|nr:EAL domain-containing protein [Rhodocyclaceae bacterium]
MKPARPSRSWLLNTLSTGTALLIAFVLLVGQRWLEERKTLLDEVHMQATLVGANVSIALAAGDPQMGNDMLAAMQKAPSVQGTGLYRNDGALFARYDRDGNKHLPAHSPPIGHEFSTSHLIVTVPVAYGGVEDIGTLVVRVTLEELYSSILYFIGSLLGTAMVATLLGLLASRGLRQRMKQAEHDLHLLALYDRVTGLSNRYAFELAIEQTILRHQRDGGGSTLLFIDVDGFKKINDRFGHASGDKVLQEIGQRITYTLRAADVVARLGGDEFGAILVNTCNPSDAAHVAESLVREAAKPFLMDDASVHIGFSIGIAMLPDDGDSAPVLMHHADLAMYHAKSLGKSNYQFFSDTLDNAVRRRLDIEEGLRRALISHELFVVYQPQVSRSDGPIEGIEALVRWRRKDGTIISPTEFIPVAEESGLIGDIGEFVLQQVCNDINQLRQRGLHVPTVAINLSGRQFLRRTFAQEMLQKLNDANLSPDNVEIELPESVLMDKLDEYRQIMSDLTASGIRIAIDDFGTGYSSLSYLSKLPVSKLKIDRSFVSELPENVNSLTIVTGIVSMAHALGLRVVAEGVETSGQAECLLANGCDLLQGFLIGRPMNLEKLAALLTKQ